MTCQFLRTTGSWLMMKNMHVQEGSVDTKWAPSISDSAYTSLGYSDTTVYDSSGFNNHGQTWAYNTAGDIEISSDTPRNNISTFINSVDTSTSTANGTNFIYCKCGLPTPNYMTVAFWCKPLGGYGDSTGQGQFCTTSYDISSGLSVATDYNTTAFHHRDSAFDLCKAGGTTTTAKLSINFTANEWHHYAVVYDGRYGRSYKDGVQTNTADLGLETALSSFIGITIGYSHAGGVIRSNKSYFADFRVYATALSAEDIQALYNAPVSVANNGAMLTQGEFVEV
jgi:hypothetical protein